MVNLVHLRKKKIHFLLTGYFQESLLVAVLGATAV
jgi:hypothetical protein